MNCLKFKLIDFQYNVKLLSLEYFVLLYTDTRKEECLKLQKKPKESEQEGEDREGILSL